MATVLSQARDSLVTLQQHSLAGLLTAIGSIWTAYKLTQLWSFVHLHFLHQSGLKKYAGTSERTWALISGASDGIGKGYAEELCDQGFNVIIHGRNETKLNKVKQSLQQRWPAAQVEILVLDAAESANDPSKLEAAASRFKEHEIRILINNVAHIPTPLYATLHESSGLNVSNGVNASALFPTQLTRAFLPTFISRKQPALVINIGSAASEIQIPYLSVYCGVKAYNKVWSEALRTELWAEGYHHIEVLHFLVGEVVSATPPGRKVSLASPSSRDFARASLGKVGCGKGVVWGWWVHEAMLKGLLGVMPKVLVRKMMVETVSKVKRVQDAEAKRA